jgi:transcriptional regulator with XRE-family HTH domain
MSQRGLAAASGVHYSAISRIEAGERQPLLAQIQQLAKALRVPPRTLIPPRSA